MTGTKGVRTGDAPEVAPRRRVTSAVLVVAVLAGLLLCCVGSVAAIFVVRSATLNVVETYSSGAETVTWSGEGRYAVIRSRTADNELLVAVWDRATGDVREHVGYRAIGVERADGVVWMVREEDEAVSLPGSLCAFTDMPPGLGLFKWTLAEEGPLPVEAETATWALSQGSGRWSVAPAVDPRVGAYPSALIFSEAVLEGAQHEAGLPGDLMTFDVVGWSPSGRYLGIVERLSATDPDALPMEPTVRILVIEAATGEVVAEAAMRLGYVPCTSAAGWHPERDVLLVTEGSGAAGVVALSPVAGTPTAEELMGEGFVRVWEDAGRVWILGGAETGLFVAIDDDIWVVGESGAEKTGRAPDGYSMAWHPEGGLLVLDEQWSDRGGTLHTAVTLYDGAGTRLKTVWEGPEREVMIGGWDD